MVKERDVVRNKGGMERETNLNRIAEQNWGELLDRTIGLEWRLTREPEISLDTAPSLEMAHNRVSEDIQPPVEPELPDQEVDEPAASKWSLEIGL